MNFALRKQLSHILFLNNTVKFCSLKLCRSSAVSRPLTLQYKVRNYSSDIPDTEETGKSSQSSGKNKGSSFKGWISLSIIGASLVGFAYYMEKRTQELKRIKESGENQGYGTPDLGGPFELLTTEGVTVTEDNFIGKWILIYFGFCHCPDICPDVLERLTNAINAVNSTKGLPKLQPIFITVDPLRDTKEVIKEYLQDFHPDFIGLTGTEEQVKNACKSYRVYCSLGPKDEDGDYIVDHTIISYLMDPDGNYSAYFNKHKTSDEIISTVRIKMEERIKGKS